LHTKQERRFLHFPRLVELIADVRGGIVEGGGGAGRSLALLGTLARGEELPRRVWGVASFDGLPAPPAPHEEHRALDRFKAGRLAFRVPDVRANLIRYGISSGDLNRRFVLVKGYFPTSFMEYSGEPIGLLHLDVDLYQSYKDCLEWFEPLVAPG